MIRLKLNGFIQAINDAPERFLFRQKLLPLLVDLALDAQFDLPKLMMIA